MKKYNIILFIVLLLVMSKVSSQIPGNINHPKNPIPESPNAASLGIFGVIPVSHYTGIPNISIPIYEINLDGKVFPISLSYHASGIRVSQEAGWVGLGWALNAGGMITRQVQGSPDFPDCISTPNYSGYYYVKDMLKYYQMHEYGGFPLGYIPPEDLYYPLIIEFMDTEPDLYTYNFGTFYGSMMTGQDPLINSGNTSSVTAFAQLRNAKEYLKFEYNI